MVSHALISSGLILLGTLALAGERSIVMEASIDLAKGQRVSADSRPQHSQFNGRYFQRTTFALNETAELVSVSAGLGYEGDPDEGATTPFCWTASSYRLGGFTTQLFDEDTGRLIATRTASVNARLEETRPEEPGCPARRTLNAAQVKVSVKDFYNQPLRADVQQGVRVETALVAAWGTASVTNGRLTGFTFSGQPAPQVHWFAYDPTLQAPELYEEMVSGYAPLQIESR